MKVGLIFFFFLSFLPAKYNQMLDSQSPVLGGCSPYFASQFISSFFFWSNTFHHKRKPRTLYRYFQLNVSNRPNVVPEKKSDQLKQEWYQNWFMRFCRETTVLSSLDTQFIFDPGVLDGIGGKRVPIQKSSKTWGAPSWTRDQTLFMFFLVQD